MKTQKTQRDQEKKKQIQESKTKPSKDNSDLGVVFTTTWVF